MPAVRLTKPWLPLDAARPKLGGQLGVFQLADEDDQILYIGYAGGNSLFGLRSAVAQAASENPGATKVRVEVTSAYLSRYRELLMVYKADFQQLPANNADIKIGTLSPS